MYYECTCTLIREVLQFVGFIWCWKCWQNSCTWWTATGGKWSSRTMFKVHSLSHGTTEEGHETTLSV